MTGPVSAAVVAHYVCRRSDWTTTAPQLHAILYFGQVYCLGETGKPLIAEPFIALADGPMVARLADRFSIYGDGKVPNVFIGVDLLKDRRKARLVSEISGELQGRGRNELHRAVCPPGGAWTKVFDASTPGATLSHELMLAEYKARMAAVT